MELSDLIWLIVLVLAWVFLVKKVAPLLGVPT